MIDKYGWVNLLDCLCLEGGFLLLAIRAILFKITKYADDDIQIRWCYIISAIMFILGIAIITYDFYRK